MTENVDLRTQLKAAQLEVDKSSAEVEKVRSIDQCHTIHFGYKKNEEFVLNLMAIRYLNLYNCFS